MARRPKETEDIKESYNISYYWTDLMGTIKTEDWSWGLSLQLQKVDNFPDQNLQAGIFQCL